MPSYFVIRLSYSTFAVAFRQICLLFGLVVLLRNSKETELINEINAAFILQVYYRLFFSKFFK